MAPATHTAKLPQPKNGKRQSTGITSELLLEMLKLGKKKNLKKIMEEESLQKAEENLVANTLHGHSALPRPPLFPPGFLRQMKAPGIHRSVNRSGQKSKQRSRENRTRNDTLKNQARKFIQP